ARYSRITELVMTRRGVVVAIDDERRRIERDLHDGVQQNVVSLSMLIARARRAQDPDKAARLLDDALAQSQDLIEETREVAWLGDGGDGGAAQRGGGWHGLVRRVAAVGGRQAVDCPAGSGGPVVAETPHVCGCAAQDLPGRTGRCEYGRVSRLRLAGPPAD